MSSVKRMGIWAALLLGVAACALGWFIHAEMQRAMQIPIDIDEPRLLRIEPGSNAASIARRLESEGWLRHYRLFALQARIDGVAGRIKAGTYVIEPGDTLADFLARIVRGETKSFEITFIEGTRFADMLEALANAPHLSGSLENVDGETILARLGINAAHPEGLFFPSTYRYADGTPAVEILKRAYLRMRSELEAAWAGRAADLPYNSTYEALIMASIIEKETGRAEEREAIAGVFVRRLRKGMKLQTDPTVIYGIGTAFDGNLRRDDLRRDTPYNTYTRGGLPPTPIALPGRAAIEAALHPLPGTALYFVAKGDGSHQFSSSLREHNNAVRRYQLRR